MGPGMEVVLKPSLEGMRWSGRHLTEMSGGFFVSDKAGGGMPQQL